MEKIKTTEELCDFILKEFAESRSNMAKEHTNCEKMGNEKGVIISGAKYDQTAYLFEVVRRIKEERI